METIVGKEKMELGEEKRSTTEKETALGALHDHHPLDTRSIHSVSYFVNFYFSSFLT